eukprot:COSAG02_NODE_24592_length_683_cov_1.056507_1_plen_147_part_00
MDERAGTSVPQTEALTTIVGMVLLTLFAGHSAAVVQKRTDFAQVPWFAVQGGGERRIRGLEQRKQGFPTSVDIAEICSGNKHLSAFIFHVVDHTHRLRCRRSDCTERSSVCGWQVRTDDESSHAVRLNVDVQVNVVQWKVWVRLWQ